jgi:hypothetical protein
MDFDLIARLSERRPPEYLPCTLAGATIDSEGKTLTGGSGMATERRSIRRRQDPASALFRRLPVPIRRATQLIRPRRIFPVSGCYAPPDLAGGHESTSAWSGNARPPSRRRSTAGT